MNGDPAQPEPDPTPERPGLQLSRRARDVLAALAERNDRAASLYEGALRVLTDRENPVRIRLAAYCLRELFSEFHERPTGERLGPRIRKLKKRWEVARRSFGVTPNGDETGFALTLDNFFVEYEKDYPLHRDRASDTIARLDPSGRTAPPVVHRARGDEWMKFSDYFNDVLHGRERPTQDAFQARLESYERFLLDWLRPQTFADFSEIDELIEEGPPDA